MCHCLLTLFGISKISRARVLSSSVMRINHFKLVFFIRKKKEHLTAIQTDRIAKNESTYIYRRKCFIFSGPTRARTWDHLIMSQVL